MSVDVYMVILVTKLDRD